ncbi:MAG TPA: hypothetical protein VG076_17375 [Acidimicrobiales bacterium]|jgi:hypothetical protein|nr:hypothetical protein [Acidimicrobiales bacterium]
MSSSADAPRLSLTQGGEGSPTEQLTSRVSRLRVRVGAGSLDRVLLVVGGTLMPLGVLLVVLGWLGASRTVLVFEQIPYMLSGGLLGVALVFAGGFLYFTYWQTLQVRESRARERDLRAEHEALVASLARIEALLSRDLADSAAAAVSPIGAQLLATPKGSMVHRPDCAIVAGRDDVRHVAPGTSGIKPCRICQPELD